MENEFMAVMANRSDQELITIVTTDRGKYQPLAIEAAEKEIEKRGISAERQEELQAQSYAAFQDTRHFESRQVDGGIRFVHFLVDSIVIIILFLMAVFGLAILGLEIEDESLTPLMTYCFVFLGYYICMECAWQQTLGKMITQTKVVTMTDDVPTNGDIIARTFCRLIPFDRLSFLFTRNGFHDSISKTTVIRK